MDPRPEPTDAQAVLAEVHLSWDDGEHTATAVVLHAARGMLVLETSDPSLVLPPPGTTVRVRGESETVEGRLAEHGRAGRCLVSVGERPVRRAVRLRVSLPGILRSPQLAEPMSVEIADLTTAGARIRGVELPIGSQVTLAFTPPGRDDAVSVRASVAHSTHGASNPWIGVAFRLVALRGGRQR